MIFTVQTLPNALRALGKFLGSLVSMEEPTIASPEVQDIREHRCTLCEHYVADSRQCVKCTCVVPLKVILATESCPIGKWGRQTRRDTGLFNRP